MFFKSLELQGFKSFPDRVKLEFEQGLTAVVGPNGSGKSNIGDAIRWVLGNSPRSCCVEIAWKMLFSPEQNAGNRLDLLPLPFSWIIKLVCLENPMGKRLPLPESFIAAGKCLSD